MQFTSEPAIKLASEIHCSINKQANRPPTEDIKRLLEENAECKQILCTARKFAVLIGYKHRVYWRSAGSARSSPGLQLRVLT